MSYQMRSDWYKERKYAEAIWARREDPAIVSANREDDHKRYERERRNKKRQEDEANNS